ncbi:hypothetical protein [Limosilactobacillus ingluviei]|uniref:hypothetical protein n=1 Tax=Limosilactobacillus ingluviei TaxID=148604 RepID=UPI0024B87E9A|nr:hypothetical protein [Limosilactobacillus ingluviei]
MFTTVFTLLTISFAGVVYFVLKPAQPSHHKPKEHANDAAELTPAKAKVQAAASTATSNKKSKAARPKQPTAPKRDQQAAQEFEYRKGKVIYHLERHNFLTGPTLSPAPRTTII